MRWAWRVVALLSVALFTAGDASAQMTHDGDPAPDAPSWTWSWDARVFLGWNYQLRKFRDFEKVESQNWLMGGGEHRLGSGRLGLHTMISLEPFTIQALGSPQVFQTGETYQRAPLVDYQHPHDLFMDLGAPALGPPSFMHRPSAAENPTVPLGHHQMDATHITHGVLTGGIEQRGVRVEASWFRGAEPDENRKDIELGRLDSYSGRVSWAGHGWDAQVSGGHLTKPEYVEPFSDVTRWTASLGYTRSDGRLATFLSWGQNREIHGVMDAYLFETTVRARARHAWYMRAELTSKDLLSPGGRHPPGFVHFHPLSRVGALTGGYVVDVWQSRLGQFGLGGDATIYHVPENLQDNYGSPKSFHVFLRYRPRPATSPASHDMHTMHDMP